ncbi:kielin/chordin-like protein [Dermacentor albipictus]|uniref:kielin/chordin-like protein n=1 Tax=Dermacentor albipictus TaxID=60249 RepID=UPI0031FD8C75
MLHRNIYWSGIFTVMVLSFLLYTTALRGIWRCRPPNCIKRPRNKTCRSPCVGYYCINGTLQIEQSALPDIAVHFTMLASGAPVIYLLCLSLTEALMFFNNVKFIPYHCTVTLRGECFLFNKTFTGRIRIARKCEMWSCYPQSHTAVVVRCGKLPHGCYSLGGPDLPLPKCCSSYCDPYMYGCHYNGVKFIGLQYSRRPCQRLSCHLESQVLVKMECGAPPEGCYLQEGTDRPFPHCCRVRCPELSVCVTSNGSLMKSGEIINSSDPCLRYTCKNGFLSTQGPTIFFAHVLLKHARPCSAYWRPSGSRKGRCQRLYNHICPKGRKWKCSDPGPGCTRVHNNETKFPQCCEERCYATSACKLPNGDYLRHGDFFNNTNPCVEYGCNNGNLTIMKQCPQENDPYCFPSLGTDQPFPTCCGVAKLCLGGSGKRANRKKRSKESKRSRGNKETRNRSR